MRLGWRLLLLGKRKLRFATKNKSYIVEEISCSIFIFKLFPFYFNSVPTSCMPFTYSQRQVSHFFIKRIRVYIKIRRFRVIISWEIPTPICSLFFNVNDSTERSKQFGHKYTWVKRSLNFILNNSKTFVSLFYKSKLLK